MLRPTRSRSPNRSLGCGFKGIIELERPTSSNSSAGSLPEAGVELHHVQIAIPPGSEDECRWFYVGVLGMVEMDKPQTMAGAGGLWLRADRLEIHLGVEKDFRPARKAHPGIFVSDLDGLARRLEARGVETVWDDRFPGFRRFYISDNLGNRIEFLTRSHEQDDSR